MVTGPANEPVTRPEVTPTDAFELLALQVPPVPLVSVVDVPTQTFVVLPVISAGNGFTETVTPDVTEHPAPLVAVTLYILLPVAVGAIAGDAHDVQDKPPAPEIPTQLKVAPGAIAVKVAELFRQTVALFDGDMFSTGRALTVKTAVE